MICVQTGRLIRGDIDEKIKRWEVWFQTPFGLCKSLHEATELMKKNELDPRMTITAVSVAIADSTYEVWAR